MPELTPETLRWKIDKDLALYQFYLDMSVKAAVFLMTVTGAIASYAMTNRFPRFVMAFPALMNGGFAMLFFYSIRRAKELSRDQVEESTKLGVSPFNMDPLKALCQIFWLVCSAATVLLLAFIFSRTA
jgi:hypothetical protein